MVTKLAVAFFLKSPKIDELAMTRQIMGQRLFLSQMRLELLLSSSDATAYWQKRARILDK